MSSGAAFDAEQKDAERAKSHIVAACKSPYGSRFCFPPPWPLMRTYSEFGMHANSPIILCIQVWRLHGLACVCALPVPQLGSRMKDTSLKRTPTIPVAASHQTVAWQWVF